MNSISIKTQFGWISIFEKKGQIIKVREGRCKTKSISGPLKKFKKSLKNYFRKKNKKIKSNFYIKGNSIQKKVWKELSNIKLGKTKSYGEIAKKYKLSPRHVGKICGQNNFLIAVPCHRVIRSDGSLGGFSSPGGLRLKKKLLDFERSWKY